MGTPVKTKIFKSGNSVALRLPKAWGFSEGDEVEIIPDEKGGFKLQRAVDQDFELLQLYGSFSPGFMAEGRLPFDEIERDLSRLDDRPTAA